MEVFVARQPVFTKHKKIYGYELLFRSSLENVFPDIDGDLATTNLLSNIFFPFALNEIIGNKKGLINFTRKLLLEKFPLFLPKDQFIIEVLEDIRPDKDILETLSIIKNRGYTLALDDFIYHSEYDPMIELCKIIKFDIQTTPLETLVEPIKQIQSKFHIRLLAEKVETHEEFEMAVEMGFNLFQGYFFARPEVLSTKGVAPNQVTKLRLINEIRKRELNFQKIESFIKNDAHVSFKLMKYANSAYFNRKITIDTIKDAIYYIGEDEIRKFINVVVISDLGISKPNELVRASIIRARMCENFYDIFKTKFTKDELFTLGLFSYMDALLDCQMHDILEHMAFSEKMTSALLGNDREFSRMLDIISGFERGDWDNKKIFKVMKGSDIEAKFPEVYLKSVKQANAFYD